MDDYRATLCTSDSTGRRKWVYPTIVDGAFRTKRKLVAGILLVNYLVLPWLVIGGKQAVRLDLPHRRFTFLGSTFQATETIYLFLLLGTAAFSLFLFTALLGRVWCGWGCPQTVFLEFLFRPIEAWVEGNAAQRRKLDGTQLTAPTFFRKILKFVIFAVISWGLASTFLAYFVGRNELLTMMTHSPSENIVLFGVTLALMALLLFQFGWFREQFCSVLCPYARFQSVLLDANSLAISYDTCRGEPRGKKSTTGDCIDCGLCVRVCPAGIDIRNGLQLECIQCASCIDACDQVMYKIGKAPGLVRYASENAIAKKPWKILRPRIVVYSLIVTVYATALGYLLLQRSLTEFEVIRVAKDAPFTVQEDGTVLNHFKIRLVNKGETPTTFSVGVVEPAEASAVLPMNPYIVAPNSEQELPLFIRIPKTLLHSGKTTGRLEVKGNDKVVGVKTIPLIGPDI